MLNKQPILCPHYKMNKYDIIVNILIPFCVIK